MGMVVVAAAAVAVATTEAEIEHPPARLCPARPVRLPGMDRIALGAGHRCGPDAPGPGERLRRLDPPGPARPRQAGRPGQHHHRLRPKGQRDRAAQPERPIPQAAQAQGDGQAGAGRDHRRRGPELLPRGGHRLDGDLPGGLRRPDLRPRRPGRQHDHPTAGQDPAPHASEIFHAKGPGGGARDRARAAILQRPDPRHVPEPGLFRPWRIRVRRSRAHIFQQGREGPVRGAGRFPGRPHTGAGRLRPQGPLRPGARPRALRPPRDGLHRRSEPG